ncbi:MAG: Do family serine endopeptidase [Pseudomonadota bacterium]
MLTNVFSSARTAAVAAIAAILLILSGPSSVTYAQGPQSVAPLAKRLSGAVVNISTSQKLKGPSGVPLPDVPDGAPFQDLFRDFFNRDGQEQQRSRKISSLGSGFVIDGTEGLIVTNNHVIDGADEITVNFYDGTKLKVDKVVGRDPKTDLALLKVTPEKPLKDVKFGSSDTLEVGDWVLAIGNPFGLGGSVSIGIISAKQRDIQSGPYDDYLQTDAAINKGNSGGPLFNMQGDVVGINTAIISPTGGSIGIGFAVPSDVAVPIIDQLVKFGETRRGWLGVNIQSATDDIAASLGVSAEQGALISSVQPKSPAEAGGIKAGDVIVKFDGKPVPNMRALPQIVARTEHGKTVAVEVMRNRKPITLTVVVGQLEESDGKVAEPDKQDNTEDQESLSDGVALGLTIAPIGDDFRKRYGFSAKVRGLAITNVAADSEAAAKDVKVGSIIIEADQQPVFEVADLQAAMERVKQRNRDKILLRVEDSKGNLRFIALPLN